MVIKRLILRSLIFVVLAWPSGSYGQSVTTGDDVGKAIALRNVKVINNIVSGEVVNRSPHLLRDVEVLIQYHWLWQDEFDPGENAPGDAVYLNVASELLPGRSIPFTYSPPSLRTDKSGTFMHEISVGGFTVVAIPQ